MFSIVLSSSELMCLESAYVNFHIGELNLFAQCNSRNVSSYSDGYIW